MKLQNSSGKKEASVTNYYLIIFFVTYFSIFQFQIHILQNTIFLALLASKIFKGFLEEDENNSEYFRKHAELINYLI